jgi:outer membrane protein
VATPPAAPVPFPTGEKIGHVNLQAVMQQSADGKQASAKLQAEQKKKSAEIEAMAKAMQANQQKLQTGRTLMSPEAISQLEKEIERQQKAGERYEQDAQSELNEMNRQLQGEFNSKLFPVIDQMCKELGLAMLFSVVDSGLMWARPGLDLTAELVKRMDIAPTPPKPAASTPASTTSAPKAPPTTTAKPPAKP